MPEALAIGISETEFWKMNPRKLKIHTKAYLIRQKRLDEFIYAVCGNYIISAVSVGVASAIGYSFSKSAGKLEYTKSPMTRDVESTAEPMKDNLTKEETIKQTEAFFTKLRIMEMNFNLNKKKEKGS